jgi:hypothetical protein
MPPLLAALLMMEFDCDIRIIQAIDLNMEWRFFGSLGLPIALWTDSWYAGHVGCSLNNGYWWPSARHPTPRYKL